MCMEHDENSFENTVNAVSVRVWRTVDSVYCEGTRGFKTPLNNVNNVRLSVARDEMVKNAVVRGFE